MLEWDVRNWSAALDFWTSHTAQKLSACSALEIGSRNGGLALWLALQGARVLATDIGQPSQAARSLHQAHGVADRIRYERIDATRIPYRGEFQIVLFKSVLGAIGRVGGQRLQAQAVNEMYQALSPGGELFFAENLVGSSLHRFCRKHFVRWGNTWRYVSIREMLEFLAPFSAVYYSTIGFAGAFGRTEAQRNVLGMIDRVLFNRAIPASWRYIIIGLARK